MRIALVIYGGLERISGGFIYDRALAGALGGLGHQVDVVALPWDGYLRALARNAGRATAAAGGGDLGGGAGARYDAVIQDELVHPSVALQDRRAPAARRFALVHNLRSAQPGEALRPLKARVEQRYLRTLDGVIAVCRRTLDDVRALAGGALPAVVAHPGRDHVDPGVGADLIAARAADAGPLRLLHAAAVRPHKGLHRLLDAMAAAATAGAAGGARDVTLDVVGELADPAYAAAIRRQVARLGLASRVRLHGTLRGPALAAVFRRCHALALPSDREAYSLSCLEALGFGLPVLATSEGGLGEMLTDGRDGFLLAPGDTAGWSSAIARLSGDRARLAAMGRAALARYLAHGTWRDTALTVLGLLGRPAAG
jgi:glycosyltransferase involved in cell wall biosynthesis